VFSQFAQLDSSLPLLLGSSKRQVDGRDVTPKGGSHGVPFNGCLANVQLNEVDFEVARDVTTIFRITLGCNETSQTRPPVAAFNETAAFAFARGSSAQYRAATVGISTSSTEETLNLNVRTREETGVIFFTSHLTDGDFVLLSLSGGRPLLRFSLGGPTVTSVSLAQAINDGRWHSLRVVRQSNRATLIADGGTQQAQATSTSAQTILNIVDPLCIGGVPRVRDHHKRHEFDTGANERARGKKEEHLLRPLLHF
jgi:hypothetical protein